MMVLALIIIPTMKCSFSHQEQNTQEQQQKNYNHHNLDTKSNRQE
jgi:hypothetical protein